MISDVGSQKKRNIYQPGVTFDKGSFLVGQWTVTFFRRKMVPSILNNDWISRNVILNTYCIMSANLSSEEPWRHFTSLSEVSTVQKMEDDNRTSNSKASGKYEILAHFTNMEKRRPYFSNGVTKRNQCIFSKYWKISLVNMLEEIFTIILFRQFPRVGGNKACLKLMLCKTMANLVDRWRLYEAIQPPESVLYLHTHQGAKDLWFRWCES